MYRLGITKQIANGGVVTIAVTILLSAFFWFLPSWLFPVDEPPANFFFMGIPLFSMSVWLSRLFAFIFWLAVWHIVNIECEKAHIIPTRSTMPFVVGTAIVTAIPELQEFNSGMVAFVFFLSALMTIFNLYTVSNQVNESFKVVLFFLISSLFVPEYIWMLLLFFIGLTVYKVRSPRIFLSVLVSLLVFAWMVWGICFSFGKASVFTSYLLTLVDFGFFKFHGNVVHLVGMSLIVIIMLIVMVALGGISHKFDARVRLNNSFINLAFLFSVALILTTAKGFNADLLMVVVLLTTQLSALYFSTQINNFANILFLVSLALLLVYRVTDGLIKIEI
ncbi:MAG: hypothetical protein MJ002_04180 [Paludibacteraceae bacterium]|nr:hypothetical protein [Paludibacteraceae bacterium]